MARRHIPPETRARVMELIAAGENHTKIAAETGVSVATVNKWSKGGGDSTAPTIGQPITESGPIQESRGAELGEILSRHPGTGVMEQPAIPLGGTGPTMAAQPSAPPAKPMDPEALIAVVTVAKSIIIQSVSSAWKVKLTEQEVKELSEFNETEKKSLTLLAPYAASYTDQVEQYAKPAMALLFCGVVMFSTVSSLAIVKAKRVKAVNVMKEQKRKRK